MDARRAHFLINRVTSQVGIWSHLEGKPLDLDLKEEGARGAEDSRGAPRSLCLLIGAVEFAK